jgi:hypothetical protein
MSSAASSPRQFTLLLLLWVSTPATTEQPTKMITKPGCKQSGSLQHPTTLAQWHMLALQRPITSEKMFIRTPRGKDVYFSHTTFFFFHNYSQRQRGGKI